MTYHHNMRQAKFILHQNYKIVNNLPTALCKNSFAKDCKAPSSSIYMY